MSLNAVTPVSVPVAQQKPEVDPNIWAAAQKLEASFLAEMLKSAGVGEARQAFGGGAGEDHFSSFLVNEYADAAVQAGGIGLAEAIYDSMVQAQGYK